MKILIISPVDFFRSYGGGEIYIKNIIDELVGQGFSPVILTPGNKELEIDTYKGCRIVTFNQAASFEYTKLLLLDINPDIVHAHGFKAFFSKACMQLNIPCIVTAHHGGILCPAGALLNYRDEICKIKASPADCLPCVLKNIRGGLFLWPALKLVPLKLRINLGKFFERLPFILFVTPVMQASLSIARKEEEWRSIHENVTVLIAPSKTIAESMIMNGADPIKIRTITHGIPLNINPTGVVEGKVMANNNTIKFFYVGRINYVKGLHIMLEAFDRIGKNSELHIIGGPGNKSEERYTSMLKRKYQNNKKIFWYGKKSQEELRSLILKFDIMIHPAICLEIFGLNIAEALSAGKPVVATRCGGPEMQIVDGVNGWLAEPNNVQSLLDKMNTAINDFRKMKVETIKVKTIETHVKELIGVYEEACIRR